MEYAHNVKIIISYPLIRHNVRSMFHSLVVIANQENSIAYRNASNANRAIITVIKEHVWHVQCRAALFAVKILLHHVFYVVKPTT